MSLMTHHRTSTATTAVPIVGFDTHTGDPATIPAGTRVEAGPGGAFHPHRITAVINGHDITAHVDHDELTR